VPGELPCSGAIMRVKLDGGPVELVAWGFRNPFGLAFDPGGQLWVTDNGYDERGSRGVFGSADWLYKVKQGAWYGWPDFADGRPLSMDRYEPLSGPEPGMVLAEIPSQPPKPVAFFGVHSSSDGFSFSTNPKFGHVGEAFVAQFGDQAAVVGKVLNPVGFKVVRVNPKNGVIDTFAANAGSTNGPASKLETKGLERPVDAQFDPSGEALYIVDFGVVLVDEDVVTPKQGTGVLWRIVRDS
jgi:glucose/arabinose dehydrogenase